MSRTTPMVGAQEPLQSTPPEKSRFTSTTGPNMSNHFDLAMIFRSKNRSRGFSLVEILIAMVILSVGLLAIIGMIVSAAMTANSNKEDTTAAMLADTVLEQIAAKD